MKLSGGQISALKCLFKMIDVNSKKNVERCSSMHDVLVQCFPFQSPSELVKIQDITRKIDPNKYVSASDFVALVERIVGTTSRDQHLSFTANLLCLLEEKRSLLQSNQYIESTEIQNICNKLYEHISHIKKARYIEDTKIAHNKQCVEYKEEWDKFEADFEKNAKISIRALSKRQKSALESEKKRIEIEFNSKPPLWSLQLKEFRKREKILAYKEHYAEAQRVKVISDALEEEERNKKQRDSNENWSRKEKTYVQQQRAEMMALVKRIDTQRDMNRVKREQDYQRLLKRNKNIQVSIGMKNFADIEQNATNLTSKRL